MSATLSDPDRERATQVVALFSVFIHAALTNDFKEAGRVQTELERRGVKVQLSRRKIKHAERGIGAAQ